MQHHGFAVLFTVGEVSGHFELDRAGLWPYRNDWGLIGMTGDVMLLTSPVAGAGA